jgi:hypothetical protein
MIRETAGKANAAEIGFDAALRICDNPPKHIMTGALQAREDENIIPD